MRLQSNKQRGTFTVEFSIVAVLFAILITFTNDVLVKISMRGKLDRLSFSAASIIKERTQLYSEEYKMTATDSTFIYNILSSSFARTTSTFDAQKFGMRLEEQTYDDSHNANALVTYSAAGSCDVSYTLTSIEGALSVTTTYGRKSTLYRVTLCYETENLVAGMLSNGFSTVSSSSVIIGR